MYDMSIYAMHCYRCGRVEMGDPQDMANKGWEQRGMMHAQKGVMETIVCPECQGHTDGWANIAAGIVAGALINEGMGQFHALKAVQAFIKHSEAHV